jgi:serine/threonine-protein kinase
LVNRQVAVKVLPRQITFDPQFRTRFQREAEVVAALEHDSIVPVYDFGEHDDQPYIVMRYLSGGTLADRLRNGPLPPAEISKLYARIGAAVDYAHRTGVIHRDIKPGNILFDSQGGAALSDFGIAKISESTSAYTATGGIVGTPAYMSPEQVQGNRTLDGRCDVYALGVVLFEALSGQTPFNADTPMGVAVLHVTEPVPSILGRHPGIQPAFETVIQKALEKKPEQRYQTAGELARAIDQATRGIGALPGTPGSTYVEPVGATYLEPSARVEASPRSVPDLRQYQAPPVSRSKFGSRTAPMIAVGGGVLGLCLCVGLIGAVYTGMIPNPFAPAPAATEVIAAASATPTETATSTEEAITATPSVVPTVFVPVGLSSTFIEYILDASGSMLQFMGGKTRLQVAQDVLAARLAVLPDNTQVGLRVYGHRIPYAGREGESCADIELVVPIQADGADDIITWLPGMQALGMTPMTASISQAANDFSFSPDLRNFIVLISDGMETCGDDPAEAVELLKEIGIDFSIHVIGLGVDPATAAQLSSIADAGGGVYYDAQSEADFDAALGNVNNNIMTASDSVPPTPTTVPSATPIPPPNTDITDEGVTTASSIYDATFPTSLGVDNDVTSSWFSAGPESDGTTTYTWTGVQDDFIGSIEIISNRSNDTVFFRTNYGFGDVTIQVLDAAGNVVFETVVALDGTPDPDVFVTPNVVGRAVRLVFTESEAFDCGGFGELIIMAAR